MNVERRSIRWVDRKCDHQKQQVGICWPLTTLRWLRAFAMNRIATVIKLISVAGIGVT